ncbi:small multi-drug export protein [Tasmannia lanceolata]|uniref:small multi-drug export protein n=1 Tax=Tasmannia lanceolata TaxID=3420 RepID=UPI004064740D
MISKMAAISSPISFFPKRKTTHLISALPNNPFLSYQQSLFKSRPQIPHSKSLPLPKVPATVSSVDFSPITSAPSLDLEKKNKERVGLSFEAKILRIILWATLWLALSFSFLAFGSAHAASDSIRASNFGLKIATALRGSGWPDDAIVFALATLPVIELRGAIPVGYWMKLKPLRLTVLSVIGNMVPVPFIILYLKRFAEFLAGKNASASNFLGWLFGRAREKAGPVEEFQWLGLMLFVAVPFPGTGAWTGAIVASILDMPFWSAMSANFFGVFFAGLLVNLLVNLGLKYAIVVGVLLFILSTVMWSLLRIVKKSLSSN